MLTAGKIFEYINQIAPFSTQCSWDNSGFIIGDKNKVVQKICFALDLCNETLEKSISQNADVLITHHPAMFHAQKNLLSNDVVFKAARANLAVICTHTPFDCAEGGVDDVLAGLLQLQNVESIPSDETIVPMLRCGFLSKQMDIFDFARKVSAKLSTTVRVVDAKREVYKVAVCGGSGMSFLHDVLSAGCDTFVTGDLTHHDMLDAKDLGLNVIAAGHFETEFPAMNELMGKVQNHFSNSSCVLINQSNPVSFINAYGS